ncbi:MAG: hypothetical protein R3E44_14145 [Paracoccaceae bacterium]
MANSAPLAAIALLGLGLGLVPAPTQVDDPLYLGFICGPEDGYGPELGAAGDALPALYALHDDHELPQSRGAGWDVPQTSVFDPATAVTELAVAAITDGPVTAGEEARITLRITDGASGLPVTGRSVAGWMLLRRNAQVAAEMPCSAKARLFTQGRVTARPDVDLNASKLLVLNRDGSIAVVNPQVDFTITQMEGVIPLPGVPADWALAADGQTLFVSLPVYGAVAVIDTRRFQMSGLIELAKGSLPTQLLPLADGSVAVYLSATGAVTIARPDGDGRTDPVAVGGGPVAMAQGAWRLIVAAPGRLTTIDTRTGAIAASATIPAGEPSLALAPDGLSVFVATTAATGIERRDIRALKLRGTVAVEPGIFALALEPGRRQIIALNRETDRMVLIDPRTGAVSATGRTPPQPVEVTFSHDYAYVRGLEGDHFSIFELAELRQGKLAPVDIQSASAPVTPREALSRARMIAPYGHGALVGNADEAVAYYYMEGMNSPMGTVKTYGPNVQGLMAIDRGFHETAPGVYETTATLPFGGAYDIPVAIDADGFVTCFAATAEPASKSADDQRRNAPRIEADMLSDMVAGRRGEFVVRLFDGSTGKPILGLTDVRLVAFSSSGEWQSRKWATEAGQGRYVANWKFPKPGRYGLSLQIASSGVGYADQRPLYFNVGPPGDGGSEAKDGSP